MVVAVQTELTVITLRDIWRIFSHKRWESNHLFIRIYDLLPIHKYALKKIPKSQSLLSHFQQPSRAASSSVLMTLLKLWFHVLFPGTSICTWFQSILAMPLISSSLWLAPTRILLEKPFFYIHSVIQSWCSSSAFSMSIVTFLVMMASLSCLHLLSALSLWLPATLACC